VNNEFLRREWGAVSFLVVTALGIVVVPIGLNLRGGTTPAAITLSSPSPNPSSSASEPAATPSVSVSPSP
jgi:hypothetical protein